ncbi:hypothetical protein GCM10025855_15070 [Shewanella glacialipiscicola]|uniref:Uncharacterized protein n=1 Tax=Shewanella glacialipiscicola TaxID=614069 RepID=A0ABQ6J2M4_9GAMM|nr:hypothetical protein GCM10025855_15070 [Shewanella glacialipiscicola]
MVLLIARGYPWSIASRAPTSHRHVNVDINQNIQGFAKFFDCWLNENTRIVTLKIAILWHLMTREFILFYPLDFNGVLT